MDWTNPGDLTLLYYKLTPLTSITILARGFSLEHLSQLWNAQQEYSITTTRLGFGLHCSTLFSSHSTKLLKSFSKYSLSKLVPKSSALPMPL